MAVTSAALLAVASLSPDTTVVHREGGVLETASAVLWGICACVAFWTAARAQQRSARLLSVWLAVLALMAGLRELDAETLLNPEALGSLGVRYKISWWIDGGVPFWLKLGWASMFSLVALGLSVLLIGSWPKVRHLWAQRDRRLVLFGMAVTFLALGFVLDDSLRHSTLMSTEFRVLLEETAEFLGAGCFLVLLLVRKGSLTALPPRQGAREHEPTRTDAVRAG